MLKDAKDKLDKLNHKIDDLGHSTNATEKDTQSRLEKRNKLEAALKKTLLKFYDAVNLEDSVMLSLMAMSATAEEIQLTISKISKYLETSMHILDLLDLETFYLDEHADKRDLTNFYGILENCQQDLNEMPLFEEQLERINKEFSFHKSPDESKSKDNFSMHIEEAISNISLKIDHLNMSICDNLGDKEFGTLLENQKQTAIKKLETLQNKIITNYNSCCIELNKANYLSFVFNRLVNIKAKIVHLFLDAETVRSTLRDMRIRQNSTRQQHHEVYKDCKPKLDVIWESLLSKNTEPLFYNSFSNHAFHSEVDFSKMLVIEPPMASTLRAQIMQLDDSDRAYFSSLPNISCLIGHQMKDAMVEQIQMMQKHFKPEIYKIKTAFAVTLKNKCMKALEETNRMGKALMYDPKAHDAKMYDNDFNLRHVPKNSLTQLFGIMGIYKDTYNEYVELTIPSEIDFSV